MQVILFFALAIAALAIIFAVQNTGLTTVSFLFWDFNGPLAFVLLLALATGALINFLFALPSSIRARWTIRTQRKKLSEMETSLAELRARLDELQRVETKEESKPTPPPKEETNVEEAKEV